MKINKYDKKLTIGLTKKLFLRNNTNLNCNSTPSSNSTRTKITINKNLHWKEQQEKNKNSNSVSYENKSETKINKKKSEEENTNLLKNEIEINLNHNFKNKENLNYFSTPKEERNENNGNLNKNYSSELLLKNNSQSKLLKNTNLGFLLHQVKKNLNKTFSNVYDNNKNRSLSSNNSLNNSIETNNTINFSRKEINNLGFNLNLNNFRNSFTSLNSERSSLTLRDKLNNQFLGNQNEKNNISNDKDNDNKLENNISSEENYNNKKRVFSNNINKIEKNNHEKENCKNDYSYNENDLEHYYILENKLKEILFKLSSFQSANNECYDWINYYFNEFIYNKIINLFKDSNNRRNLIYIIKIELLCFCLCYHVSYDKNLSKVIILLKSIFEQIHSNYLVLVRFILHKTTMTYENYIWYEKLYNVIKNELSLHLNKKDLDEYNIILIINHNINTIGNYFKLIIDNIYLSFYQPQNKLFKFPSTLYGKIEEKLKYSKEIISSFFFDAFSFTDNYTIEDINKFFNLFLFKTSDQNGSFILSYKVKFQNKENHTLNNNNNNNNINTQNNNLNTINQINSTLYYLPKINPIYKYSLVLDLDETLIYLKKDSNSKSKRKVMILRPFLHEFLSKMKKIYELILFSYETQEYVDPILDLIEKKEKYFEYRLYKEHTKFNGKDYIKDLSKLGRDLRRIIIIDNIPQSFKLQKNNGICIKPFYGDVVSDRNTLKFLGSILEKIRYDTDESNDIRESLRKQHQIIFSKITSDEN